MGDGLGGRSKKEGTCVYMWLIHMAVQQKLTQLVRQLYTPPTHTQGTE